MSVPKWAVGMQRIGPGMYVDGNHAMHIDAVALCLHYGVLPSPENQRIAQQAVLEGLREKVPGARVEEVDDANPS